MKFATSVYTFLLFSLKSSCGSFDKLQMLGSDNCTTCRRIGHEHFESLKRVAIIKAEILRRIGLPQPPSVSPSPPPVPIRLTVPEVDTKKDDYEYELSDILSYSEAPDNFTDENIVQFKLTEGNMGKRLHVKSANLLIRVKCSKNKPKREENEEQNKSKRDKRKKRKKHRSRMVDLVISTVNAKGRPGDPVASVKSKLKKTKWLKLSLPQLMVQQALESNNKTLQVYVQCVGCGKRAKLILVHKRRKRRRANDKTARYKLHKRRPMLFLHTRVTSGNRVRRSARVQQCDANSGTNCCKSNFVVDFESREFGWENWIISPKRYRTAFCEGVCNGANDTAPASINIADNSTTLSHPGSQNQRPSSSPQTCVPVRWRSLHLTYYNGDGAIVHGVLPNMIVTKCGCR